MSKIHKKYLEARDAFLSIEGDIKKAEDNATKAAGKRARRVLQKVKKLCHELRAEIIEVTRKE